MNETCDICEKSFDRSDLEYVALHNDHRGYARPDDPPAFYGCAQCVVQQKLTFYHSRWIECASAADVDKTRYLTENNLFRTMMMGNDAIITMSNESSISIKSYLIQHKSGWEKLPLDSIHMFLTLLSGHAQFLAAIMTEKSTKEEIQAHLVSKTQAAKIKHTTKLEIQRQENTGLKGTYTKDEAKAVKSFMKQMNVSEEQAYTLITGMLKTSISMRDATTKDETK